MVSDRSAHFFDKHPVVLKFGYPQIRHCVRCELFCQKSRLSRPPEAPIFGKISRFSQNPGAPIFRKICHFRKFLNCQISVKIRGFVRNFRKIWDFWHNYMMYWINSGYKCRVSDRDAHFFDRRPVLCNNIINIYICINYFYNQLFNKKIKHNRPKNNNNIYIYIYQ